MNGVLHRMEAAPLTRRFILLLASKRRLFALPDIIRAYRQDGIETEGRNVGAGDQRTCRFPTTKLPN